MGDVNGDGVVDLLAGSTGRCFKFCVAGPGSASVVSGATGAILQQWTGSSLCDYFGLRVASPGDLDGDGIPDAVVDVPGVSEVRVFSTASGTQLASYPAAGTDTYQSLLTGLIALEDVDGDGFREFALQGVDAAHVQVISVATGAVLYTVNPPSGLPYPMLGESLVTPGDVNGDGVPELAFGVRPGAMPGPSGVVRMYSLAPAGVSTFGSACPQSNGKLARIGAPHAAHSLQHFTVNLSAVPPNQGSVAMFGLSNTVFGATGLPWNLASYGMPACSLFTSIDLFYCMQTTQIRPGEGAAAFTAVIPPGLAGVPFYAQWGVLNPVGAPAQAAVSRALAVTIQ